MLPPVSFITSYKNYRRALYLIKRAGPVMKGIWNASWRYSTTTLAKLDRNAGLVDEVGNASPIPTCIIRVVWPSEED